MANTSTPHLLFFTNKGPSVLKRAMKSGASTELLKAVALELEPRDNDHGWKSFWEHTTEFEADCIRAGFAARREKRNTLDSVSFPKHLADEGCEIRENLNLDTFECIGHFHRTIFLEDETVRLTLAGMIVGFLQENSDCWQRTTKGNIEEFINDVYQKCLSFDASPDLDKAGQWINDYISHTYSSDKD